MSKNTPTSTGIATQVQKRTGTVFCSSLAAVGPHRSSSTGNDRPSKIAMIPNEHKAPPCIFFMSYSSGLTSGLTGCEPVTSGMYSWHHRAVQCRPGLGEGFILHHQNSPAALSGHTCARGLAHPTYCCRVDTMNRQSDCPPPRKRSCLL
jgi:hypothetical protein